MQSRSSHDPHSAPARTDTVLIIEDDPAHLLITEHTLRFEHIPFTSTENIDDGWEQLQRGDISVVITDLSLGAVTLIKRMRATERFATIPVIVSSGVGYQEQVQQALDAGAQAYLIKPHPLSTLVELVRRALGGAL